MRRPQRLWRDSPSYGPSLSGESCMTLRTAPRRGARTRSLPGSVATVREDAALFLRFARSMHMLDAPATLATPRALAQLASLPSVPRTQGLPDASHDHLAGASFRSVWGGVFLQTGSGLLGWSRLYRRTRAGAGVGRITARSSTAFSFASGPVSRGAGFIAGAGHAALLRGGRPPTLPQARGTPPGKDSLPSRQGLVVGDRVAGRVGRRGVWHGTAMGVWRDGGCRGCGAGARGV